MNDTCSKRSKRGAHGQPRPVGLAEVARAAGVSVMTVSRALNTPEIVDPVKRQRVLDVVERLHYIPRGAGRALRMQCNFTFGAVIPTVNHAYFAATIEALQLRFREGGFSLLVASYQYDLDEEYKSVREVIARGLDGLVLVGLDHHPRLLPMLEEQAVPYIVIWTVDAAKHHPYAGFDNRAALAGVTRHLLDLGHRSFAIVSMPTAANDRARERIAGVVNTLGLHGLTIDSDRIIEAPVSAASGRQAIRDITARHPDVTAVICCNDMLAAGALAECAALGIDVPRQMSITGFGDMEIAPLLQPALTTVAIPTWDVGARAADYLLERLAGRPVNGYIELPTRLVQRASTGSRFVKR